MDFTDAPDKTEAVFNELAKAARERRTIEYGELAEAVSISPPVAVTSRLGFIRNTCQEYGLPWLTAIVVSEETKRPAVGIFNNIDGMSGDVSSPVFEVWWRAMVLHVFATDWSTF